MNKILIIRDFHTVRHKNIPNGLGVEVGPILTGDVLLADESPVTGDEPE